ncbi:hypothetical protein N2152v2_008576 [Parachlorella kessleri]
MQAQAGSSHTAPVTLYTAGTPNGWKASVALEELGIQYSVRPIELGKNQQKEDWFLKINPNGRIPAIVDHEAGDLAVWESGAVLLYLAEQKDPERRLLPTDTAKRIEVLSWLFWQVGGLGPMQGQADWWVLFAPDTDEFAIERYRNETKRLFGVMDSRLEGREWLAADQFTIADIACFTWVVFHDILAVPLAKDYPNLRAWVDRIKARDAVRRGLNVPAANPVLSHNEDWNRYLAKAAQRLKDANPTEVAEE